MGIKSVRTALAGAFAVIGLLAGQGIAQAAGVLDQSQTAATTSCPALGSHTRAQVFTASRNGILDQVDLRLSNLGDVTGALVVELWLAPGGQPTGVHLVDTTADATKIPALEGFVSIPFTHPSDINAGLQYALVAHQTGGGSLFWCGTDPGPYAAGGSFVSPTPPPATSFTATPAFDHAFRTYVTPPTPDAATEPPPATPPPAATPAPTPPAVVPVVPVVPPTAHVDANAKLLECAGSSLAITDISQRSGRVRILGVTKPSNAGHKVGIDFATKGHSVATATVAADGSFRATAPLPARSIRNTDRARYSATLGDDTTSWLKLTRRITLNGLHVQAGGLAVGGHLVGPLAKGTQIVVTGQTACDSPKTLGRFSVGSNANFSRLLHLPATASGLTVRLTALVRTAKGNATTYTITRPIQVR